MVKKSMNLANFNITFGESDLPMLEYFESVIYKALQETTRIRSSYQVDTYFSFQGVKIKQLKNGDYVLVGNIIKETRLEVKTILDNGKLVPKNELHPTAPYSRFIIFLKNHRMVLVKNEAGSPSIRTFSYTFNRIITNYIKTENKRLKEMNIDQNKLPYVTVNIVSLPLEDDIEKLLEKVDKVELLKLRLFPLNKDVDFSNLAEVTRESMNKVGSKTGNIVFNSPQSKVEVANILKESAGLVDSTVKVKYNDGTKETIKGFNSNSTIECELSEEIITENSDNLIIYIAVQNSKIQQTSVENLNLYEKFKDRIRSIYLKN